MKGYLLFWKRFGPLIGILLVDVEQLGSVVPHLLPFRAIRGRFWQMHFFAHKIRASEHHAHAQRIGGIAFA